MSVEEIKNLFKFSWAQAFSDTNSKSSITAVAGFYLTIIGGLGFIYGGVTKDYSLVNNAVLMSTLGVTTLTARKIVNGRPVDLPSDSPSPTSIPASSVQTPVIQDTSVAPNGRVLNTPIPPTAKP